MTFGQLFLIVSSNLMIIISAKKDKILQYFAHILQDDSSTHRIFGVFGNHNQLHAKG